MDESQKKKLKKDPNGLVTYEYIANNINDIDNDINDLVENIIAVDRSGQFVVSAARYLNAIDKQKFATPIDLLIKAAITKDKDRAYLADLASSIWGKDYKDNASMLAASDDNFRRIYKRLYPTGI